MKLSTQITLVAIAIAIGVVYLKYDSISSPLPVPKFDANAYWGPGKKEAYKEDKSIKSFKINYSDKVISELTERINNSVLPKPLEEVGFDYGVNSKRFSEFLNYWQNDYLPRWKSEREPFLNSLPQFTTQIQGYVHWMLTIISKIIDQLINQYF